MVMSVVENAMEAEIRGLVRVVRVMVGMGDWLGDLLLESAASTNGGGSTGEVHRLVFRPGLSWLCLAMALLKTLFFERADFLEGEII
jgi:hypothetical protein